MCQVDGETISFESCDNLYTYYQDEVPLSTSEIDDLETCLLEQCPFYVPPS